MAGVGAGDENGIWTKSSSRDNAESRMGKQNKEKILAFKVSQILISILLLWFLYVCGLCFGT
jgi:hypothetical protein